MDESFRDLQLNRKNKEFKRSNFYDLPKWQYYLEAVLSWFYILCILFSVFSMLNSLFEDYDELKIFITMVVFINFIFIYVQRPMEKINSLKKQVKDLSKQLEERKTADSL